MTADEARELMRGSIEYKGAWFKARLNWFCGRINKKIECAAEHGSTKIEYQVSRDSTAQQYFPIITKFYEDLGYYVVFSYHNNMIEIYWDISNLSPYTINKLRTDNYYNHHIKLEEFKNEGDRAPDGHGKDKRATRPRGRK